MKKKKKKKGHTTLTADAASEAGDFYSRKQIQTVVKPRFHRLLLWFKIFKNRTTVCACLSGRLMMMMMAMMMIMMMMTFDGNGESCVYITIWFSFLL